MSRPSRKQVGFLLLVMSVALFVAGCGSGGEDETTTTGLPVVTTVPPASGSDGSDLIDRPVAVTDDTPADFVEAYGSKPLVVLFYVPGGTDDVSVFESLYRLIPSFGNYVFLMYDYKVPDAYGDLSSLLAVEYPPQIVLIDREGLVREVWNGYVDEGTLNQSLVNLDRT